MITGTPPGTEAVEGIPARACGWTSVALPFLGLVLGDPPGVLGSGSQTGGLHSGLMGKTPIKKQDSHRKQ